MREFLVLCTCLSVNSNSLIFIMGMQYALKGRDEGPV